MKRFPPLASALMATLAMTLAAPSNASLKTEGSATIENLSITLGPGSSFLDPQNNRTSLYYSAGNQTSSGGFASLSASDSFRGRSWSAAATVGPTISLRSNASNENPDSGSFRAESLSALSAWVTVAAGSSVSLTADYKLSTGKDAAVVDDSLFASSAVNFQINGPGPVGTSPANYFCIFDTGQAARGTSFSAAGTAISPPGFTGYSDCSAEKSISLSYTNSSDSPVDVSVYAYSQVLAGARDPVSAVPEPHAWLMLLLGLGAFSVRSKWPGNTRRL